MTTPLRKFAELSAIGFGLGLSKRAPGTVGSLGGLVCGFLIHILSSWIAAGYLPSFYSMVVFLLLVLTAFAWWSIAVTERAWGSHDSGKIVIDEFAGQAIAVAFFAPGALCYIAGFIFFRIFDIWKPGPIGAADENLEGAAGTLVDDLLAGVVAAACTGLTLWLKDLVFPAQI